MRMRRDKGCVFPYHGKRGTVWRIKYFDASGERKLETLGKVTKQEAEATLRERLVAVEKHGHVRPGRMTFETFARQWLSEYPDKRSLKKSTRESYRTITEKLIREFGTLRVSEVTVARVESYVSKLMRKGASPKTVSHALGVLSLICRAAIRSNLLAANPVPLVDRPRPSDVEWRILSGEEVRAVEVAFAELAREATEEEGKRDDLIVSLVIFKTVYGAGLRRGEVLGLRWRDVVLSDPLEPPSLRVVQTWTRNEIGTPKSRAGRRTVAIGERLAAALFEHRGWSQYQGDDEIALCNPRTGRPFNHHRYGELFREALERAGIEGRVRPFHDGRHACISHQAAAGVDAWALMTRAGHSNLATTMHYVNLASVRFADEAAMLERRLYGETPSPNGQSKVPDPGEPVDSSRPGPMRIPG
jgi:integrase